jgi:hypothetical protein
VCVGLGVVSIALRLPLLVGLLVAGVVVGLKLDPHLVHKLGPIVLVTGMLQGAVAAALAYVITTLFRVATVPALYLAAGMASPAPWW